MIILDTGFLSSLFKISIIVELLKEKDFYKFKKDVFMRLKDCDD